MTEVDSPTRLQPVLPCDHRPRCQRTPASGLPYCQCRLIQHRQGSHIPDFEGAIVCQSWVTRRLVQLLNSGHFRDRCGCVREHLRDFFQSSIQRAVLCSPKVLEASIAFTGPLDPTNVAFRASFPGDRSWRSGAASCCSLPQLLITTTNSYIIHCPPDLAVTQ